MNARAWWWLVCGGCFVISGNELEEHDERLDVADADTDSDADSDADTDVTTTPTTTLPTGETGEVPTFVLHAVGRYFGQWRYFRVSAVVVDPAGTRVALEQTVVVGDGWDIVFQPIPADEVFQLNVLVEADGDGVCEPADGEVTFRVDGIAPPGSGEQIVVVDSNLHLAGAGACSAFP